MTEEPAMRSRALRWHNIVKLIINEENRSSLKRGLNRVKI